MSYNQVSNLEGNVQILESTKIKLTDDIANQRQNALEFEKRSKELSRDKMQLETELTELKGLIKAEIKVSII